MTGSLVKSFGQSEVGICVRIIDIWSACKQVMSSGGAQEEKEVTHDKRQHWPITLNNDFRVNHYLTTKQRLKSD